jgi:hypothetical protein
LPLTTPCIKVDPKRATGWLLLNYPSCLGKRSILLKQVYIQFLFMGAHFDSVKTEKKRQEEDIAGTVNL